MRNFCRALDLSRTRGFYGWGRMCWWLEPHLFPHPLSLDVGFPPAMKENEGSFDTPEKLRMQGRRRKENTV